MGATPSPPRRSVRLRLAALALLLVAAACGPQLAPAPAVAWDTDPDAVILQTTFCCGLNARYIGQSEIATAQIRGGGRMIWVERVGAQYRERRVWTSALNAEQLTAVLQQIVEAGFYDWDTGYYREDSPTDLGDMCLQVRLLSAEHQVCEYAGDGDAPKQLHTLYDLVANGAGRTGEPFVPQQGLVTIRFR